MSILELQDLPVPEVTVSVLDLQDMPVPADDRDTAHGVPNTNLSISIC